MNNKQPSWILGNRTMLLVLLLSKLKCKYLIVKVILFIICGRKLQWCMMAYLCRLLLIAILTVASGATPLDCSDVQSPASGDSHNTDLSQVTSYTTILYH